MKKLVLLILPVLLLVSCKKAIDKAKEQAVIDAITTGYWKVTQLKKGDTDATPAFNEYKFQFKENNTVDAFRSNAIVKSGTWHGDATAMTIHSSFGNVSEPLLLLNGLWKITNNSMTLVEANQTVGSELYLLRLNKE